MSQDDISDEGVFPDDLGRSDSDESRPAKPVPIKPAEPVKNIKDLKWEPVYGVALRITRDVQMAEDVAQSVFSNLLALPESARKEIRCLRIYARRAAKNGALNAVRNRRGQAPQPQTTHEPYLHQRNDPALQSVDREEAERLLSCLSDTVRERFILCRIHGYSAEEVAAMVGAEVSAVQKSVSRALECLKKAAAEPPEPSPRGSRILSFFKRKEQK
jgi:RNA polymerase sigma factor (sigma-70 family)